MPKHDPAPRRKADYQRAALAWERYKRTMRWMILVALAVAALSVAYLWRSGDELPLPFIVATFAGVALTMLVGTGLMGLVYLSNRSGHDEELGHGE